MCVTTVRLLLVVSLFAAAGDTALAQIRKDTIPACNKQLEDLLLNRRLIAKVTFPASARGIDLTLDGNWDPKDTSRRIKGTGIGIDIDQPGTVNQVKLKEDLLEIQLNGGGFGSFMDHLGDTRREQQARKSGAKAAGGSRVNLRFNRPISCDELADANHMIQFVAPLLDASSLKAVAALQGMSPEWAEAAAQKKVLVGMEKTTVFAIFGEPKQKQVDLAADVPLEKWMYELADLKTRVITFREGKVAKIDEF